MTNVLKNKSIKTNIFKTYLNTIGFKYEYF